jgi:predicted membrane protein
MLLVIGGRLPSTQCHKDTWGNKSTIGVVPEEVSGPWWTTATAAAASKVRCINMVTTVKSKISG